MKLAAFCHFTLKSPAIFLVRLYDFWSFCAHVSRDSFRAIKHVFVLLGGLRNKANLLLGLGCGMADAGVLRTSMRAFGSTFRLRES